VKLAAAAAVAAELNFLGCHCCCCTTAQQWMQTAMLLLLLAAG
jgi:hypothetical protein